MNKRGLSLLEVSLAIVFLLLPLSFFITSRSDVSDEYLINQLSYILCKNTQSFSEYLKSSTDTDKVKKQIPVTDVCNSERCTPGFNGNVGNYKISYYTNDKGVGLVVLYGTNTKENVTFEKMKGRAGMRSAYMEGDKISTVTPYFSAFKNTFPDLPENIIAMTIIPPVTTPFYYCNIRD
mgnify:CR=1 FL=1